MPNTVNRISTISNAVWLDFIDGFLGITQEMSIINNRNSFNFKGWMVEFFKTNLKK